MAKDKTFTKIQELTYELKVRDAMIASAITVEPKQSVSELREVMRVNRISGAPVVDQGRVVGLISIEDFIKCQAQGELDARVEQKMTTNVDTLYADEPLVHAVRKFDQHGYGRFPVIEREDKHLVGILTKGNIIKCLLKKLEIDYHEEEIHRYRASHIFEDIIADRTRLLLEYDIAAKDFDRAGQSASELKKTLYRLGISPEVVRRVAIAAFEAEVNIIVFSDGGKLTVSVCSDRITLAASDRGPGIPDTELAMQPSYSTAPDWIREMGFGAGMGLSNIKNCADEMSLVSQVGKGTDLEVIIHLNGTKRSQSTETTESEGHATPEPRTREQP